ncbi:MAG: hypothetical protein ACPF9E_09085 [Alteromonas oceani]
MSNCIVSITCGALLWEIHQAFIPEMYFDWKDMVATLMAFTALMLMQQSCSFLKARRLAANP